MRADFLLDALAQDMFDRHPKRTPALIHQSDSGAIRFHQLQRGIERRGNCALGGQLLQSRWGKRLRV